MKTFKYLTAFAIVMALGFGSVSAAQAEPKPVVWYWPQAHDPGLDFTPYIEPAKEPHNSQWDQSDWTPRDWIAEKGSQKSLLTGLYRSEVLADQYMDDTMPILVVGPAFYMLGGQDKRRVVDTVAYAYDVMGPNGTKTFLIEDSYTDEIIGAYSEYGLQLQ